MGSRVRTFSLNGVLVVMETPGGSLMALQLQHPRMKDHAARDVTVVHFTGCNVSLDEVTLYRIHDELLALADDASTSDVLLDFGNVQFLTGTTLGTLVVLHKKLVATGRHLTVGNLNPQVHEVFTVTKLDQLLDLRPTGAVGVLQKPSALTEVLHTLEELAGRSLGRRQDRWIQTPRTGV
jgi:anti-sigma B factor antagonist